MRWDENWSHNLSFTLSQYISFVSLKCKLFVSFVEFLHSPACSRLPCPNILGCNGIATNVLITPGDLCPPIVFLINILHIIYCWHVAVDIWPPCNLSRVTVEDGSGTREKWTVSASPHWHLTTSDVLFSVLFFFFRASCHLAFEQTEMSFCSVVSSDDQVTLWAVS